MVNLRIGYTLNVPVESQALVKIAHIAFTRVRGAMHRIEGGFSDHLLGINGGHEGSETHQRPLQMFSENAVWAIPWRGVFVPP